MIHPQAAAAAVVQHMSWTDVAGLAFVLAFICFMVWVGNRD